MSLSETGLAVAGGVVGVALVNKISDAVGGIAKPYQIRRVTRAETEAEIESLGLRMRAATRFLNEETIKQSNMESIVLKGLRLIDENLARPEDMDDDLIRIFFEHARLISDENMQELWARILAGDANAPGTFSRKTINVVSDLGRREGEIFNLLSRFVWYIDGMPTIVDIDTTNDVYNAFGIDHDSMAILNEYGLISRMIPGFDASAHMIRGHEPVLPIRNETATARYRSNRIELTFANRQRSFLWVGSWKFSQAGKELLTICDPEPIEEFFQCVCEEWQELGLIGTFDESRE